MDLLPKVEENLIEEEPEIIEDEENEVDNIDDIFVDKIDEPEPEPEPEVKPIIKPIKKKREMSAEHKAKLMAGRLKGLETRRKKAAEKKEIKELKSKKVQLEKKELIDYVNQVKPEPKIIEKIVEKVVPSHNEEDIEKRTQAAIKKALDEHEEKRQIRKKEKRENLKKQMQDKKINDMCVNASLYTRSPQYGDQDFFDVCFK